jgi:hypothetical protein
MTAICFSERSVDFTGIHGVITQKIELFVTSAVRTSNPKYQMKITDYKYLPYVVFFIPLLEYFLCLRSKYFPQSERVSSTVK